VIATRAHIDPDKQTVDWLALREGDYRPVHRSGLIDLGPMELAERIDWPPIGPAR
jgi:hypothetical protein